MSSKVHRPEKWKVEVKKNRIKCGKGSRNIRQIGEMGGNKKSLHASRYFKAKIVKNDQIKMRIVCSEKKDGRLNV